MAIQATDSQTTRMVLMAELDRLLNRDIGVRAIRRIKNTVAEPEQS
jgi:hypothetical protein